MAIKQNEIKILEKELRRIRIKNLQMKLHMEVLIMHPLSNAAMKIREKYADVKLTQDQILSTQN